MTLENMNPETLKDEDGREVRYLKHQLLQTSDEDVASFCKLSKYICGSTNNHSNGYSSMISGFPR